MNNEKVLDVSWNTIFKFFVVIICAYFIFLLREVLIWVFFAVIISLLFSPLVDFLQKKKIPRIVSALFIYLGIFGVLSFSIYLLAPHFLNEVREITRLLPDYFEKLSPFLREMGFEVLADFETVVSYIEQNLEQMATHALRVLGIIFGGISAAVFIIAVSFFISLEKDPISKFLAFVFPRKKRDHVLSLWSRSQKKVVAWFWVRILQCIFVGALTLFVLLLFEVEQPFWLALMTGISNFIIIIGPIIAGIIMFVFIVLDSWLKAIFVLVAFTIIQTLENYLLTPFLTKKFLELSPALVLIMLVIGAALWGVLGALLIIPLAGILFEFLRGFLQKRREEEEESETLAIGN